MITLVKILSTTQQSDSFYYQALRIPIKCIILYSKRITLELKYILSLNRVENKLVTSYATGYNDLSIRTNCLSFPQYIWSIRLDGRSIYFQAICDWCHNISLTNLLGIWCTVYFVTEVPTNLGPLLYESYATYIPVMVHKQTAWVFLPTSWAALSFAYIDVRIGNISIYGLTFANVWGFQKNEILTIGFHNWIFSGFLVVLAHFF